jgi:hypothetical protein
LVLKPQGAALLASLVGSSPNDTWSLVATDGGLDPSSKIVEGWLLNLYISPIVSAGSTDVSMSENSTTTLNFTVTDLNGKIAQGFRRGAND